MFRNLFVFCFLLLSGCIVVYSDDPSEGPHHYYDEIVYESVWVEDLYTNCHEEYWDTYDWYFEIYADSYYGPADVEYVDVYINSWKWVPLDRTAHGYWDGGLNHTYFDCESAYDLEVVATDYYGNTSYRMFYW
jgi:hypothetical protein